MKESDNLSPKERVLRFLSKLEVDCMPCFSGMGNVTTTGLAQHDIRFARVHGDAQLLAKSAATTHKLFDFDCAVVPYDLGVEAEVLGSTLNVYPDSEDLLYPTLRDKTVWKASDIKVPADLEKAGRIPVVCEAIRLLKEDIGDRVPIGTYVLGPFVLAGQIVDLDHLLKMALKDPAEAEKIVATLTEVIIEVARIYKKAGADYITVREMGASASVVSPRVFKKLVKPYVIQILASIKSPKILHMCGDTNSIVTDLAECGADAVSVDQRNDLKASREKVGRDVLLLGNFDPFNVLVNGTPELVVRTVKNCIENGADAVWPGCDLWPTVPPENIHAYVSTVHSQRRR